MQSASTKYRQRPNISAGQKTCDIIKSGDWVNLRYIENIPKFFTCQKPIISLTYPWWCQHPEAKPEIHATTTCGGRSICRLILRSKGVRALLFRATSPQWTEEYLTGSTKSALALNPNKRTDWISWFPGIRWSGFLLCRRTKGQARMIMPYAWEYGDIPMKLIINNLDIRTVMD